jgi:hypothetical protein
MKKSLAVVAGLVLALGGVAPPPPTATAPERLSPGSPRVLSGNDIQVPIHVPINVCGNTIDVIGVLNPAVGNTCVNH